GDPAAGARRETRHRDRARSGAGVPRSFLAADHARPLGAVRGGDCRVRPGGGDRVGDRAEPAVRDSAAVGHRDHGARRADPDKLYIAIGILGATVMPHNLYLHSSVVQTRAYEETAAGKRMAVRYAFLDSTVALSFALFINAAILIVAAATFHRAGHTGVAEIQEAYQLLTPL